MACDRVYRLLVLLAALVHRVTATPEDYSTRASDLRVEYQRNPLGLSEARPRFSFVPQCLSRPSYGVQECPRGLAQGAYRIVVTDTDKAVDVWDSGKVMSNRSSQIPYAGEVLTAYSAYKWTAQWWSFQNPGGDASPGESFFEMGPINTADWKGASWLKGPQLRANFALPERARLLRARAYIAAPGGHTLHVNRKASGDEIGVSAWLAFDKSVVYHTHDITELVASGSNSMELLLGTGFYGHPAALVGFSAVYTDGKGSTTRFEFGSHAEQDGSSIQPAVTWQQTNGPIVKDNPFHGTTIDWRFMRSSQNPWVPAESAQHYPKGTLRPLSIPSVKILRTISPRNVTRLPNGNYLYEFPENFVGVVQLKLASTPANCSTVGKHTCLITAKHGEVLMANGSVSFPWDQTGQTDTHILSPDLLEGALLTPRFTWHGFQYVEVAAESDSGFDGHLNSVTGLLLGPSVNQTGLLHFSGGHEARALNAIQGIVLNSQLSNIAAYIPTDCPTREKRGWMGDAATTAEEALFNFDMAQIYTNFLQMIVDDQHPNGDVPFALPAHKGPLLVAPTALMDHVGAQGQAGHGDISWTSAYPLIARWLLKYYGDLRVVANHWQSLKAFVDQLTSSASSHCTGGLADYFTFGDWCAVEARHLASPGTGPEMAAFNYILSLDAMAEMATALAADPDFHDLPGAAADASKYASLAKKFRPIFHERFFNTSTNAYGKRELELQSLTAAPLALGTTVPDSLLSDVLGSLSNDIKINNNHFTVGSVGAKHLLTQLSRYGLHEEAMAIATQTTFPSFGYWLDQGATTCWESYRGVKDASHPPAEPTHNHIFLCGGIGEWMYRSVGGVSPASDGYEAISIAPMMGVGPTSASAQLMTIRGIAAVTWSAAPDTDVWTLNATIPVGSSAMVEMTLPSSTSAVAVRESGATVWDNGVFHEGAARGIASGRAIGATIVEFQVASGSYSFEAQLSTVVFA